MKISLFSMLTVLILCAGTLHAQVVQVDEEDEEAESSPEVGTLFENPVEDVPFRPTNPLQNQPRLYEILEISVSGNEHYGDRYIISTSNLQAGTNIRIPGEEIPQAIRLLHNTGLFSDVKIYKEYVGADGVNLEIVVNEPPRLDQYTIEGGRRSHRRDLEDMLPLSPGFAVTEASIAQTVKTIERYYRDNGYRNTLVDVRIAERDTLRNRVSLLINIDRGDRIQIKTIEFEGNESFSDRRLRRNMGDVKRNRWFRFLSRQTFHADEFEEGKDELLAYYRQNGFLDARITKDSVYVYSGNGDEAIGIHLKIEEGPQYRLRNITWDGNTVYTDEELTAALQMEHGDVFDQKKFEENLRMNRDNTDVTSMYNDVGYLFFHVEPEFRRVEGDSIDVSLFIVEDEIATVRRVEFSGNTKTHDNVIRRNLRNLPGSRYSRSNIIRTIRELSQLGYFNPEAIVPDLDVDMETKEVDIYFMLEETQSTDNFELSGGYGGRQFGMILAARVNFNNFSVGNMFNSDAWRPLPSGDGQRLSLGVQITGGGYQNFSFGFQEPWFLGRPNSFGVNLSYSLFSQQGGTFFRTSSFGRQEMFSGSVSYGRRLSWPDDMFRHVTRLRYQYFDVQSFVAMLGGQANILSLEQEIQRNSVDNPLSPNRGSNFSIRAEAAPPIPGFSQYFKTGMSYQYHIPVAGKLVATYGAEFGYMNWFSSSNQSQFQRFFLGGTPLQQQQVFTRDNIDMRGFPGGFDGSISPYQDGQEVGGTIYNKYLAELRYPVISSEQVQLIPYLFAEAGNAYLDYRSYDPFNVKRAAGIGARIFMPILGLIDLSYGYRFDGLEAPGVNAGEWQFLFNIGSPF